ncbi:MAG TPA: SDR family oxidoreductase [Geminicoccaceae bacterium]|nr:SDR family oxidoreductase [Geminicoccus sp.]HMU52587.1 SDR family oxidoreductase [Geminicoccaceae bacterium]
MAGRLNGRAAIVTGAAQGIGAAIAMRLAEEGAAVVVGDLREAQCRALAERIGGAFRRCDVASEADLKSIVADAVERHGRLDILVQNAGIYPMNDLVDIPVEEWDRVLAVNLRGCFLAARAALPVMKAAGYGRIVMTSSITGPRVVPPRHAHYAASKAGINGLIRAAALEAAPFGVTVNGVEPGNIATEGLAAERSPEFIAGMEASIPMRRLGTPRDVADAVLFLASDEAGYITGTTIVIDGGQTLPEGKV